MSLSWQQGSLQSVWILDLWTADGHWTAAIHLTVRPPALSMNVTEHQHYILPNIYKAKLVSTLILPLFPLVLLFPPPSQKALLISDPQLTTLLESLCFAALESRISTFYLPVLSRWAPASAEKEMALSFISLQASTCPMSLIRNLDFWGLVQILLSVSGQTT